MPLHKEVEGHSRATIFWEVGNAWAETLELQRLKVDLMYIYKIVFGLLDVEHDTFDIKLNVVHPRGLEDTAVHSVLKRPTAESMHAVIF